MITSNLRHRLALRVVLATAAAIVSSHAVWGQDDDTGWNRISINGRLGFNVTAKFVNTTPLTLSSEIGPATGGGLNRDYVDGYVHVDASENNGGMTWNWGYNGATQVSRGEGGAPETLNFHSIIGNLNVDHSDDPTHLPLGVEVGYARLLGHLGKCPWGVYVSAGWTTVPFDDKAQLVANVTAVTDKYQLNGVEPPLPGYQGTAAGPGALIGDSPSRSSAAVTATTDGRRIFDVDLIGLKLGPTVEVPIGSRFAATFSAGVAAAWVDGDFRYAEQVTFEGLVLQRGGAASNTDFEVGAYVQGRIGMRGTGVYLGFEYQYLPDYELSAPGKTAILELGGQLYITAGVNFAF